MAGSDIQRRQELANNSNNRKMGVESNEYFTDNQYEVCGLFDATLVMTLSSVKQLLLDTSNEITLSYYVLLTNNENYNLKKYVKCLFISSELYNVHIIYDNVYFFNIDAFMYHVGPKHINPKKK